MATITPVTFNTGSTISGTTQIGELAAGTSPQDYSTQPGGLRWWSTPNRDDGYVIAHVNTEANQPNPLSVPNVRVGFWKCDKTEEAFIQRVEYISLADGTPQTFTGGTQAKEWLNNNGYWTSYIPSNPYNDLQIIAEYLRGFMPEFRNPSFYAYQLDGNGYEINDGGGDMYDNGNISSPWIIAGTEYTQTNPYTSGGYPYAVDYTNSATTTNIDTSFGYISLGYQQFNSTQSLTYLPLTVLGARDNITYGSGFPIGFQTGGNSGADGGGTLASGYVYSGSVVSGFTVYAFFRETFNAGDPSHCDLYILLGHSNWDSNFGSVNSFAQPTNQGGCGGYLYTSGFGTENILAIKTLLSKNGGQLVTLEECQTVVNNFILRIKESLNF
jgi:hypothetical protein